MADSTTTRDIRKSIQDAFAHPKNLAKGFAKSFLASSTDFVAQKFPVVGSTVETNRDLFNDIRSGLGNVNSTSVTNKLFENETVQELKKLAEYALDDLKTGKIYEKDRKRAKGEMFGFDLDMFNESDIDPFSYDENGDYVELDEDTKQERSFQVRLAEVQEEHADQRTEATISAVSSSTQALTKTNTLNTQRSIRASLQQHVQLMNSMNNLVAGQNATYELINNVAESHLNVAREAHEQIMGKMDNVISILEEIRNGVVPKQVPGKPYQEPDEVFGVNGELNLVNFFKNVVKNVKSNPLIGAAGSIGAFASPKDIIKSAQDNPFRFITDAVVNALVPTSVKEQMERTGRNMSSFLPALFQKFSDRGKAYAKGESSSILDMVLGFFGVNQGTKKAINTARTNVNAVAPFTRKTSIAIEEVIPTLLAKIASSLSGSPLQVYDYKQGKFVRARDVIAKNEREVNDLVTGSSTARNIMSRAGQYKFATDKEREDFQDYTYQFLQKAAEEGRFVNPNKSKADFMNMMPKTTKDKELYYRLLRGILQTIPKEELQNLSREFLDTRATRDRNTGYVNERLDESGLLAAFSGIIDKPAYDKIQKATTSRYNEMKEKDLDELLKTTQMQNSTISEFGATNQILNEVLNTLRRGIVTYSYKLGDYSSSSFSVLPDNIKAIVRDARGQQFAGLTEQRDQSMTNANLRAKAAQRKAAEFQANNNTIGLQTVSSSMTDEEINAQARDMSSSSLSALDKYLSELTGEEKENAERYREQAEGIGKFTSKIKGFFNPEKSPLSAPLRLFSKGLKSLDSLMFRVLFGKEATEEIEKDDSDPSILSAVTESVSAHLQQTKDWFAENIGNPVKEFLFNKEDGILPKVKNFFMNTFGINDKIQGVKDAAKGKVSGLWHRLVGVKDEEGMRQGGILSDQLNRIRGNVRAGKQGVGDVIRNSVSRLLYGDYATTKGVGADNYYQDFNGKMVPYGQKKYGGVIGNLKRGFDSLQTILFGEENPDGTETESRRKWNNMKSEFKKAFPSIAVNAAAGAGLGLLTSLWLPGGPVVGGIMGSVAGLIKGSDQLKEFLFGKEVIGEDGKPTREGKLISQTVYEGVKKFTPKVTFGAIVGGLAGGLGLLPLGAGPIIGTVLGSIGGMTAASDKMKKLIFGDNEDPNSGLISKNARENITKHLKQYAPSAMTGALAGTAAWGLISNIGIIPGLSLLPGGPILGFLGAATGIANAENFNKFLFGKEVEEEETVEVPDGKGGTKTVTRKKKKRDGGIFGSVETFMKDKFLTPIAKKVNSVGESINKWFNNNIIGPLSRSIDPLKEALHNAGRSIKDSMTNIGEKITDSFRSTVDKNVGKPLGEMFKEKFIDPLSKLGDKIMSGIGKILGTIISAPFKMLEYVVTGKINGKTVDEIRDEREIAREQRREEQWQKRREQILNRHRARREKRRDQASQRTQNLKEKWSDAVSSLTGWFSGIGTKAKDATSNVRDRVWNPFNLFRSSVQAASGVNETMDNVIIMGEAMSSGQGDYNTTPGYTWEDYQRETGGEGTEKGFRIWKKNKMREDSRKKRSFWEKQKNERSKDKTDESISRQDDKREATEEETKEREKKTPETQVQDKSDKDKLLKRRRSSSDYLSTIARYSKKIYNEINGQVNGVGWNTAYIKTLLEKQYGTLSSEELPEEMEGSNKRRIRRRRTFIGRTIDNVKEFFTDRLGGAKDLVKEKAKDAFDFITRPFRAFGRAVSEAGKAVKTFGSGLLKFTKFIGSILGETLKQAVQVAGAALVNTAKIVGEAGKQFVSVLGTAAKSLVSVIGDVIGTVSTMIRSGVEVLADIIPDIAHFAWRGVKAVGRGIGRGIRGIGRGIGSLGSNLLGKVTKGKVGTKIIKKKIGMVEVDGGTIDKIEKPVFIKIGSPEDSIYYPFVQMVGRKAIRKPHYAIPVYLAGFNSDITFTGSTTSTTEKVNPANNTIKETVGSSRRRVRTQASASRTPTTQMPTTLATTTETPRKSRGSNVTDTASDNVNIYGQKTVRYSPGKGNKGVVEESMDESLDTTSNGRFSRMGNNINRFGGRNPFRKMMNQFKKYYRRVNNATERAEDPSIVYDRMVRDAKDSTDIQAIALANQLNNKPAVVTGQAEEKKSGLLDLLSSLLGLGNGGLLSRLLGRRANTTGKAGIFSSILSALGVAGMAWNTFSGDERSNPLVGAEGLTINALRGLGIDKMTPEQIAKMASDPSGVGQEFVDNAATKAAQSGAKGDVKAARNLTRFQKLMNAIETLRNPSKADDLINAGKMMGGKTGLGMKVKGYAAKGIQKVGSTIKGFFGNISGRTASTATENVVRGLPSAAANAAESATKNAGLVSKVKEAVKSILTKFFDNRVVKTVLGKFKNKINQVIEVILKQLSGSVLKDIGKKISKNSVKNIVKMLPGVGAIVTAGFAVADFITGLGNAYKYFGVYSDDVTGGMRITSAIVNVLAGLLSVLPFPIGALVSTGVSLIQSTLVRAIYNVFADEDEKAELAKKQKELEASTAAYNAANGTDLTSEEYAKRVKEGEIEDTEHETSFFTKVKNFFTGSTNKDANKDGNITTQDNLESGNNKVLQGKGRFGRSKVTPMSQTSYRFNQSSKDMAVSGCGPTAAAMVASAYGKRLDPQQLSEESYGMGGMRAEDGGTNPQYFSEMAGKYGRGGFAMRQGKTDAGQIAANLKAQQPVVVMGRGGAFGPYEHYMVADSTDGKGKASVVDPYNGSRKTVPINNLTKNTDSTIYSWGTGKAPTTPMKPVSVSSVYEESTNKTLQSYQKDPMTAPSGVIQRENMQFEKSKEKTTSPDSVEPSKIGSSMVKKLQESENEKTTNLQSAKINMSLSSIRKSMEISNIMDSGSVERMANSVINNNIDGGYGEDADDFNDSIASKSKATVIALQASINEKNKKRGRYKGTKPVPTVGKGKWGRGATASKVGSTADVINLYQAWPANGASGGYGEWRDNHTRQHAGVDLHIKGHVASTPLQSFTQGTVVATHYPVTTTSRTPRPGVGGARGNYVIIKDNYGYYHIYQHLNPPAQVRQGQSIKIGDIVGLYGNTGSCYGTTGLHLHYEVRPPKTGGSLGGGISNTVDPKAYLNSYAGGEVTDNLASVIGGAESSDGSSSSGGLPTDASLPSGIRLMNTVANYINSVGDWFQNKLDIILMNNSSEDSSSSGASGGIGADGSTGADMMQNARIVYQKMNRAGMPDTNISGMLGNWQHESGIDPTSIETIYGEKYSVSGSAKSAAVKDLNAFTLNTVFPKYASSGIGINKSAYQGSDGKYYPGIGLGQWTGPRAEKLVRGYSNNWYTTGAQLAYMTREDGRASWLNSWMGKEESSPANAAYTFLKSWEGGNPGNPQVKLGTRQANAKAWYDKIKAGELSATAGQENTEGEATEGEATTKNANGTTITSNPMDLITNNGSLGSSINESFQEAMTGGKSDDKDDKSGNGHYGKGRGGKSRSMMIKASTKKAPTQSPKLGSYGSDWGQGTNTNLDRMDSTIKTFNQAANVAKSTEEISQISKITKDVQQLVNAQNDRQPRPEGSDANDKILTLLTQSLSVMINLLTDIKQNTTKVDTDNDTTSSISTSKSPSKVTTRGDNFSGSLTGGQPKDVGSILIDKLTSK